MANLGCVSFIVLDGSYINSKENIKIVQDAFDITIPNDANVKRCTFINGNDQMWLRLYIYGVTNFDDFISRNILFSIESHIYINDLFYDEDYYNEWTIPADCYKGHPHGEIKVSEIYTFYINGTLVIEILQDRFNSKKLADLIYSKGWSPDTWKQMSTQNLISLVNK